MLYFYFNKTRISDKKFEAIANDLGFLLIEFLKKLSLILPDIKCYSGSWSKDPQFKKYPDIYNKKWILCSLDEESVENSIEDILNCVEKTHSFKLDNYDYSLDEMGLHFDYIIHISNKEVDDAWKDYMAENNLQYLEESIGDRNMTLAEKISFVSTELLKIGSAENTLIIVDPYFFPEHHDDDYAKLFEGVVKASKVSRVKVIINKRKFDKKIYEDIRDRLSISMTVYNANDIHDRWWIIDETKRGLLSGTSLNGVGKGKLSSITELSREDIKICLDNVAKLCKKENIIEL